MFVNSIDSIFFACDSSRFKTVLSPLICSAGRSHLRIEWMLMCRKLPNCKPNLSTYSSCNSPRSTDSVNSLNLSALQCFASKWNNSSAPDRRSFWYWMSDTEIFTFAANGPNMRNTLRIEWLRLITLKSISCRDRICDDIIDRNRGLTLLKRIQSTIPTISNTCIRQSSFKWLNDGCDKHFSSLTLLLFKSQSPSLLLPKVESSRLFLAVILNANKNKKNKMNFEKK